MNTYYDLYKTYPFVTSSVSHVPGLQRSLGYVQVSEVSIHLCQTAQPEASRRKRTPGKDEGDLS